MPPPISRISSSSWTISGLSKVPAIFRSSIRGLLADQLFGLAGAIATHDFLGEHTGKGEFGHLWHRLAAGGVDRAFGRGGDRELETLHGAVAELDGALRADLDAGIAFPALLGLLVEGLHGVAGFGTVLVQLHQVVRADVHAGGLVLALATVAFFGAHKGWHCVSLL